ncbi:hypothetical protein CEXT_613681 [Caerostris extrusa]|uniref:Uncharacterized protein n=1 Tax=Caerostris extrusa TaxID=172846 RepID=A0AAV4XZ06_CAEEX|nr:hypothetical protein CEXT_613681 [Caerostris extrusa]
MQDCALNKRIPLSSQQENKYQTHACIHNARGPFPFDLHGIKEKRFTDDVVRKGITSLELSMKHKESKGIIESIHDGNPSEAEYLQKHPLCIPKGEASIPIVVPAPSRNMAIDWLIRESDTLETLVLFHHLISSPMFLFSAWRLSSAQSWKEKSDLQLAKKVKDKWNSRLRRKLMIINRQSIKRC